MLGVRRLLIVGFLAAAVPVSASALVWDSSSYPPVRRSLPSGLDLFESGLYWWQDLWGPENIRDPASIVSLMEVQAARYFDFGHIAYRVGGARYAARNVLERSHFQNRVRDRLFSWMATWMGFTSDRMPQFSLLSPRREGSNVWSAGGIFWHPGGPRVSLRFHFYYSDRGWRIFEVTVNGRSAVQTLRRAYLTGRL
jgi:hypothetical protein